MNSMPFTMGFAKKAGVCGEAPHAGALPACGARFELRGAKGSDACGGRSAVLGGFLRLLFEALFLERLRGLLLVFLLGVLAVRHKHHSFRLIDTCAS